MRQRGAIRALWQLPNPRRLLIGQAISQLGDGIGFVAFTLLVLDTTHSAPKLALTAAARTLPQVALLLLGGALVDRFPRRHVLLWSDSLRGMLTLLLCVLIVVHSLHYWELLAYAVLFGASDAVFFPAMSAFIPEIVPEINLGTMNSLRPLANNLTSQMIGPAVGGLLVAYSTSVAFALNAVTFFISAAAILRIPATPLSGRNDVTNMFREIREGLAYVTRTRWLWTTMVSVTLANAFVFSTMGVLIPYLLRHQLHESTAVVGYVFALSGASGTVGAIISSQLALPRRRIRIMWTYWCVGTLSALAMFLATNVWWVLVFPVISSPMILLGNVIFESMMQSEVPRALLGRVSSIDWFVSLGVTPLGIVVAGSLAGSIGVGRYYLITVPLSTIPGLAILLSRKINAIDAPRVHQTSVAGHRDTTGH